MGGFKSNHGAFLRREEERWGRTQRNIAGTIVNRGHMTAPYDKGDLQSSGRTVDAPNGSVLAVFGGDRVGVPYGRIQELGGITGRGYNTKIIGTHYLERAGDSVVSQGVKPFYDMSK